MPASSTPCLYLVVAAWLAQVAGSLPAADAVAPTAPAITEAVALAAYDRFRTAPLENLYEAPVFLRYMQGGAVHTVLNRKLVFWMYGDYPPDVQAVLYAAYMGGNLDSQLRTRKQGDDPEAGMNGVLDAYAGLKAARPAFAIAELDELARARREGRLGGAIAKLMQPAAPP